MDKLFEVKFETYMRDAILACSQMTPENKPSLCHYDRYNPSNDVFLDIEEELVTAWQIYGGKMMVQGQIVDDAGRLRAKNLRYFMRFETVDDALLFKLGKL